MDAFTALAEPTRRNIMEMLATNESLSATDIYKNFKASAPAISQHLKVLKTANLVRVEKPVSYTHLTLPTNSRV